MKKMIFLLILAVIVPLWAQDYYTDGLVYQELYDLSWNFQERVYKKHYIDKNNEECPAIWYFYGRLMNIKKQDATEYFNKISPKLVLFQKMAELSTLLQDVEKNQAKIREIFKAEKDITVIAGYLTLAINQVSQDDIKLLYVQLLKPILPDYVGELQAYAQNLYRFYYERNTRTARALLQTKMPVYRNNGTLCYDCTYYNHLAKACFYLATHNPKDKEAFEQIVAFCKLGDIEQASKTYKTKKHSLKSYEQICLSLQLEEQADQEKLAEIIDKYLEEYEEPEELMQLFYSLLDMNQTELVANYLPTDWDLEDDDETQASLWYLQYNVGDEEMKEQVRKNVDNWWSMYGVENVNILSSLRLTRCVLGEKYITPHVRRLLAVNNPFYNKSQLLLQYPSAQALRSIMLLYVAAGRQ